MATSVHSKPSVYRLSWPAALVALTACGTLLVTYGAFVSVSSLVIITLMSAILVAALTPLRLPAPSWTHWLVRAALYGVITLLNWNKLNDPQSWLFDTTAVSAFGMLATAELTIQAARRLPPGENNGAAICLLSGFIFLAACTTDQVLPIRIASPLYFALTALSLPRFTWPALRREGGGSLRLRLLAIAGSLAVGILVYFLFYLFRVPLMQLGGGAMHSRQAGEDTGLSPHPTLDPTFGQRGSFERVLRVSGDLKEPYLRGLTFLSYGQGHWGRDFRQGGRRDFYFRGVSDTRGPGFPGRTIDTIGLAELHPEAQGPALHITTFADVGGLLFVPPAATGVRFLNTEVLQVQRETARNVYRMTELSIPPPYDVVFGTHGQTPLTSASLDPDSRTLALLVSPDIDPRLVHLAQQITRFSPTPAAKAEAVKRYLIANNRYSLTTSPGLGDPVSDFVLNHHAAHCEFFASAAVILLRAAGVPARYVSGYYAHETHGLGVFIVRQQDAHAWAEAWIAPKGWTTIDATPPDGNPSATAERVPQMQRTLELLSDKIAALRIWLGRFTVLQILSALAAAALLYFTVRWLWRRWRHLDNTEAGFSYSNRTEMAQMSRRYEAWLRKLGAPCPPEIPWDEHAHVSGLESALPFVVGYNALRFGAPRDKNAFDLLQSELARLEHTTPQVKWDTEDAA